jgi:hypothetical protein
MLHRRLWAAAPVAAVMIAIVALWGREGTGDVLVDIREVSAFEVASAGFTLTSEQALAVEAVGAGEARQSHGCDQDCGGAEDLVEWKGNAWIVDAATRELVWDLLRSASKRRANGLLRYDGTLNLPAGTYIVHYGATRGNGSDFPLARLFAGRSRDYGITIRGVGMPLTDSQLVSAEKEFQRAAFVVLTGLVDDVRRSSGFTIDQPTEVEIYAIGEAVDGETFDYGWVINADTRAIVWQLDGDNAKHAGGAAKNRMVRTTLTLTPGSYAAFAVTDGSHDVSDWNAAPPYDPAYWGLTIRATRSDAIVESYPYRPTAPSGAIVSLIGAGDDESRAYGFTLTEPLAVRVYAVGEGSGGNMYDYGWILDARTRQPVWRMEYARTDHAGGAEKNRVVDEIVSLDAGSYLVYFVTDDSHAFDDWNATPPIDGDAWGITLFPADGDVDLDGIGSYDPAADPAILARLTGIGDDAERNQPFKLDASARVRVYALGEGAGGEMYDFAWIEDADTRRVVWKMDFVATEHAGGASKNRLFSDTIRLEAGRYVLHYRSDGSHSAEEWNATPPADPFGYGVTLLRVSR